MDLEAAVKLSPNNKEFHHELADAYTAAHRPADAQKEMEIYAMLSGEAKNGQILIDINVRSAIEAHAEIEFVGELSLKGFTRPMKTFNALRLKSISAPLPGPISA